MADILHDFPIKAPPDRVVQAISNPVDLDHWWTKRSVGEPKQGVEYELWFGPQYDWRARVTRCVPAAEFELEMTRAENDWLKTRVGFQLEGRGGKTQVRFYHKGWPGESEHYRISSYCWAMYLRILRRYLEHGESVPYGRRLDA
jgi:uncharacterized protein YndB with AHSA1/START domain